MGLRSARDDDLGVHGGAQGMAADHADVRTYAEVLDRIGSDLASIAARAAAIGIDDDVLTSAPFATRAFAQVQGSLAEATAGSNGLLALALRLEGRTVRLRTKADLIEAADSFGGFVTDTATQATAFTIGALAVPLAPVDVAGTVVIGGMVYGKALAQEGADSLGGFLIGELSWEELAARLPGLPARAPRRHRPRRRRSPARGQRTARPRRPARPRRLRGRHRSAAGARPRGWPFRCTGPAGRSVGRADAGGIPVRGTTLRPPTPRRQPLRETGWWTGCARSPRPWDVQVAARHADQRTPMRYDRARKNLDRDPNDILAACMPAGT